MATVNPRDPLSLTSLLATGGSKSLQNPVAQAAAADVINSDSPEQPNVGISEPQPIVFSLQEKMQHICDDLIAVNESMTRANGTSSMTAGKKYEIEGDACKLVASYARELTGAILEEAALLAKHRSDGIVSEKDVLLVLAKKFNIEVPGHPRIITHNQILKLAPTSKQALSIVPQPVVPAVAQTTVSQHFRPPTARPTAPRTASSSSAVVSGGPKEDSKKRRKPAAPQSSQVDGSGPAAADGDAVAESAAKEARIVSDQVV